MNKIKCINKIKLLGALLITNFASINFVHSALDTSYGTDGIVTTSIGGIFDYINSATLQPDNKCVVTGVSQTSSTSELVVARYNTDGSLDTDFNSTGIVPMLISNQTQGNAVTLQSDGKIVVAGLDYDTSTKFAVLRFNTDGSLDTSFNSVGYVTTAIGTGAQANSVKVQSNGKIVAAGAAVASGSPKFALIRYNSDGTLDTGFGSSGIVLTSIGVQASVLSLAIQGDGKIIAAGYCLNDSVLQFALARYNTDGTLDTGFGSSGIVQTSVGAESRVFCVGIQSDGKIVASGYTLNNGIYQFATARYNTDGTLDTDYNSTGMVTTSLQYAEQTYGMAIQPDDKVIVGGYSTGDVDTQFALVRYNTDGSVDTDFGTSGAELTSVNPDSSDSPQAYVYAVNVQTDSKVVAAGYSDGYFALARYTE